MKKWYLITGVLALLMVISVGACSTESGKMSEPDRKTTQEELPESRKQVIILDPLEVESDYQDNPMAADARYKGKLVEISGTIREIMVFFGSPIVIIEGPERVEDGRHGPQLNCSFEDEEDILLLHKGEAITVRGRFSHVLSPDDVVSIVLKDCYVME